MMMMILKIIPDGVDWIYLAQVIVQGWALVNGNKLLQTTRKFIYELYAIS
jgi:hypothetical protein